MYQGEYERKLISVDQALEFFHDGQFIAMGAGPNTPVEVLSRLHELHGRVSGLRASTGLTMAPYPAMVDPTYRDLLFQESMFHSPIQRIADKLGMCSYMPTHLRSYPQNALRGRARVDLLVTTVSPMDRHGCFSVCAGSIIEQEALRLADRVIVEVCAQAPRTFGDTTLHISQIDHIIETDHPVPALTLEPVGATDLAIGRHVAELVEDGATLQLGIGSIPNAVAQSLMGKKDLGIHTEMLSDGVVDLVEAGVINGRKKTLFPGKIVTVFTLGTRRLYDFVNDNPLVVHRSAAYTNDPYVIAQNYRMTSINTTLQVDLFGQCASEAVGPAQISGVGGQLETAMGAQMSPGGRSIMALHSTADLKQPDGSVKRVSKIMPVLDAGTVVTTGRADVEFIATEFGVAELKGRTLRDRAKALIQIAHPDFRPQLEAGAKQLHLF